MSTTLFQKTYDGDDVNDLFRDVHEAFDTRMNPEAKVITTDKHGLIQGNVRVTIEYLPGE